MSSRVVAGIELGLKVFAPADSATWHRHEGSYGCLVLSGAVQEERSGAKSAELGPGDCTWRPPCEQHRFRCGSEAVHVLTFDVPAERLGPLAERGLQVSGYRHRHSGVVTALGQLLRAELLEAATDLLPLESLLFDFLAESVGGAELGGAEIGGAGDAACRVRPRWLERVWARLHEETGRKFRLAGLAEDAGVHPIHLARTFRRQFGCPLGAYHRRLRLDVALRALFETDQSLAEIALIGGFYDQSHFSNVVKRAVGASPSVLRGLRRSVEDSERVLSRRNAR